jgi:hypothetical protein
VLVFQIVHSDAVLEDLREFPGDDSISFRGDAIGNDMNILEYYGLVAIPGAHDLKMFKYVYFFRRYLSNKQIKTFVLKKFQI